MISTHMFTLFNSLFVSGCLLAAAAAPSSIGVITSPGEFRVDGSIIRGNSNVFDGNVIETAAAQSVLELAGVRITLSPQSRAQFFRDRTILENGTGLVRQDNKHVIEAATLRILPASKDSVLQIVTSGPKDVTVTARTGSAEVRNSAGLLVASLRPGMTLAFAPQAGASAAATMTGILQVKGGTFLLTDTTTNVTVQLQGTALAQYAGQVITITGSVIGNATPAAGASQVIQVTAINGGPVGGAAPGGAGASAPLGGISPATAGAGAAAGGISAGTTAVIVAGVGVAGAVGGLALTGTFSGSSAVSR